ncbi:hypothetical protein AB9P05_19625 [Roseivirga sp. BDSF3-8]|uniref:VPS10 domain-containing protein n=1 Tax=Roseivirga sp. BDSF3-8 TaxID=3241598 RepID=UPI003531F6FA
MKKILLTLMASGVLFTGAYAQSKAPKVNSNTFGEIKARQIGPAVMSGRVAAVDAVQDDPRVVYVGAASGGVWKSKNGGVTFKPVFDEHTQSIGAIAIDQSNPDTVWVGTGEPWTRNSTSVGNGIFKSTDGGEKWTSMGLEETERIARIAIHPEDPNTVYVAALGHLWGANEERGVFKTTDGGQTWNKVLYVDENTGASDITIDPENPDILYAGMWTFRRTAYDFQSGGKGSGVYKSTDGGETWRELSQGLPDGRVGRVAVGVSPVNTDLVYALVESENTALYRSFDKGNNWEEINTSNSVKERPFYFSNIYPDPVDTGRVWKPGFTLYVSADSGRTFQTPFVEGGNVHSDLHAFWVSKEDNDYMYVGTDGGLYVSNDKGNTWRFIRNLPISQFYAISVDNEKPYYNVYGGLQDNGSWVGPSKSPGGIANSDWKNVGYGDGFNTFADPDDRNILYWQYQGGKIRRMNSETGEIKVIEPYPDENADNLRYNWEAPVYFGESGDMYVGAQYLFRSSDRGDSWERISPDLTTNDPQRQMQEESGGLTIDNSTAENNTTIFAISESPLDRNVLWVGTDDGNVQVSRDGGKNWTDVTGNLPGAPAKAWVSSVFASPYEEGTAFVTIDAHRQDDKKPYVYKTTDYGASWTSLVDENIKWYAHDIIQDPVNSNLLFLGTESGLFLSVDGGSTWSQFTGNVPNVAVHEMVIHPEMHDLVLGTHGRGVMIIDDLTPLRNLTAKAMEQDVAFLESRPYVIRLQNSIQGWNGDEEFVGNNSTSDAVITYYLKKRHIFGDMFLEILDDEGKVIDKLPAGKGKGINRVSWNVRKDPPKVPSSPTLTVGAIFGPTYSPGDYTVRLTKGDDTYTSTVTLMDDPESKHSDEGRAMQRKIANKAYDMLEDLAFLDKQVTTIQEKASEMAEKASGRNARNLKQLASEMEELHKELVATKEGDITGEVRMRERISDIYGGVINYLGAPTESQIQGLERLEARMQEKRERVNEVIEKELPKYNKALSKNGMDEITVMTREQYEANLEGGK